MVYGCASSVEVGVAVVIGMAHRNRPHIIPILLRHFVMSPQQQQRCHTIVDIIRGADVRLRAYQSRQPVEKGERKRCLRVRPCGVRDRRIERGRKAGKESELEGEQGGANEWTTGLTAAECTAGSPTILRLVSSHLQIRR